MPDFLSGLHFKGNNLEQIARGKDDWYTEGPFNTLSDAEERRVIFAALDSFR